MLDHSSGSDTCAPVAAVNGPGGSPQWAVARSSRAVVVVGVRGARHWACHMNAGRYAPCGRQMDVAASPADNGQDGQAWWVAFVGPKSRRGTGPSRHLGAASHGGCTNGIPSSYVVRVTAATDEGSRPGLGGAAARLSRHSMPDQALVARGAEGG